MGKRVRINITSGTYKIENFPVEFYKTWLGGRGLNSALLSQQNRTGIDPLSPQNQLCFATGALVGTFAPLTGNAVVSAGCVIPNPSHTTTLNGNGSINLEGSFGTMIKYAGYDQIVIDGRANYPSYILINNHRIEFIEARHLWGLGTRLATVKILEERNDPDLSITLIGPAGENLVPFASIVNEFCQTGGREGIGAIFGSKNLKAIAVGGTNPIRLAYPNEFSELCWTLRDKIHDYYSEIQNEYAQEGVSNQRLSCWSCPVACGRHLHIISGKHKGFLSSDMVYQGNHNRELSENASLTSDLLFYNGLAKDLGVHVPSIKSLLLPYIESLKGCLLAKEDIDLEKLKNDDFETSIKVLKRIARGGCFSKPARDMTTCIKKNNWPGEENVSIGPITELEKIKCIIDSLGGCSQMVNLLKNLNVNVNLIIQLLSQITGIDFPVRQVFEAAVRIISIERTNRLRR